MRVLSALLVALLALGSPLVVRVETRTTSVLLVSTPRGLDRAGGSSALIRETARILEGRSGLRVLSVEQSGVALEDVARCPATALLGCMVRLVAAGPTPPAFLFVLSAHPVRSGKVRLSLLAIDVAASLALIARGGDADQLEDAIFASGASGEPEELDPDRTVDLRSFLESQLEGRLRAALERRDEWAPFGAIELDGAWAGVPLILDGRVLGVTTGETIRLEDLRPGDRRVMVGGGDEIFEITVAVERGETTHVLVERTSRRSTSLVSWAGLGVATAGVVLASIAAVTTTGQLESRCLLRSAATEPSCDAVGFATTRFDTSAAPALDTGSLNPPGVALVPLGASLVVAGGVTALGPQLFDHELTPVLSTVVGVALGAAAYGLISLAAP